MQPVLSSTVDGHVKHHASQWQLNLQTHVDKDLLRSHEGRLCLRRSRRRVSLGRRGERARMRAGGRACWCSCARACASDAAPAEALTQHAIISLFMIDL